MSEKKEERYVEVEISTGQRVRSRWNTRGRDLVKAETAAGRNAGQLATAMATIAVTSTIDGQPLPYEDVLSWEERDIAAVINARAEAQAAAGKSQADDSSSPT